MLELDPAQVHVVQQWVQKAEHDLTTAAHTLKLGAAGPTVTRYPGDYEPITLAEARRRAAALQQAPGQRARNSHKEANRNKGTTSR